MALQCCCGHRSQCVRRSIGLVYELEREQSNVGLLFGDLKVRSGLRGPGVP